MKTGEKEALWVLSMMYKDFRLESSDKPDILIYSKSNGSLQEGIEVVTCSRLDRQVQGKAAKYGINNAEDAKAVLNSIKAGIDYPMNPKILEAINEKVLKWESGSYKDCEIKSIAVVVSDFLCVPKQTRALLITSDNHTLAGSMSEGIGAICRNSVVSQIYVILLEDHPDTSNNGSSKIGYSIWTYNYKGLLKEKCFTTYLKE